MSTGSHHELSGVLLRPADGLYALETDGGGVWRLDIGLRWGAHRLVGRRVRVSGTRAGFDLLDVERLQLE